MPSLSQPSMPYHPVHPISYGRDLRRLFVWFGLVLTLIFVDQLIDLLAGESINQLRLRIAYLLPILGVGLSLCVHQLARKESPIPRSWIRRGGMCFILGGALFDLFATLYHNPSLTLEGNPYIRVLLDSGHSLAVVYSLAVATQVAFLAVFLSVWLAFLRHLPRLLATIENANPTSRLQFLKAATGGGQLSVRQWLLPLNLAELPELYHCFWTIAVPVVFGSTLFRWYVGLEWFDVFQPSLILRGCVIFLSMLLAQTVYFVVLWNLSQRRETALRPPAVS